jgi:hypothetical protein
MLTALATLINRLDSSAFQETNVIRWGCPVPSFGDLTRARVATLGLNPSNREFMDDSGNELQGLSRRFHTLHSLGLRTWSEVDARHIRQILDSCLTYFQGNPYNTWFRRLDQIVTATKTSFYDTKNKACHLDLIPFATERKWTELSTRERTLLLTMAGDTLGLLLRDSPVRILILNGRSVVQQFEENARVYLERQEMYSWSLPRQSKLNVIGVAYRGVVDNLSGIGLGRKMLVLGFNHNLQSSFGVTTDVVQAIRRWIARLSRETSV